MVEINGQGDADCEEEETKRGDERKRAEGYSDGLTRT